MRKLTIILTCLMAYFTLTSESGCDTTPPSPQSDSGVKKASIKVQTDLNGNTIEQNNIIGRLKEDNKPGAIKHLYILSAYSGQVLIYSTVKGKVTSSGKRLTPTSVDGHSGIDSQNNTSNSSFYHDNRVTLGDNNYITSEVLGDDGSYGNSVEYVYWWDSKGVYHQQYITGGMILHISSQPLAVKSVVLNMEINQ